MRQFAHGVVTVAASASLIASTAPAMAQSEPESEAQEQQETPGPEPTIDASDLPAIPSEPAPPTPDAELGDLSANPAASTAPSAPPSGRQRGSSGARAPGGTRRLNATTVVTDHADGTSTARIYQRPVNFQDEDGEWQAIDNSIVERPGGREVGNRAGRFRADVRREGGPLLSVEDEGWSIGMSPVGGPASRRADRRANTVNLPDLLGNGIDVRYAVTDAGVKEEIVL